MATETYFGIEIPDEIAETLFTVGSLHEFVVKELHRVEAPRNSDLVYRQLRDLICEKLGIGPDRVTPEARFVQDLKID